MCPSAMYGEQSLEELTEEEHTCLTLQAPLGPTLTLKWWTGREIPIMGHNTDSKCLLHHIMPKRASKALR